jgi:hypothetical protein
MAQHNSIEKHFRVVNVNPPVHLNSSQFAFQVEQAPVHSTATVLDLATRSCPEQVGLCLPIQSSRYLTAGQAAGTKSASESALAWDKAPT